MISKISPREQRQRAAFIKKQREREKERIELLEKQAEERAVEEYLTEKERAMAEACEILKQLEGKK